MDKKTKQDWCAALRSGQYTQGTGALRDDDNHYCCLGVLTDIVGEMPNDGEAYGFDDVLNESVMRMVGLNDVDPQIEYEGSLRRISNLNDEGLTFEQLATLIEEQL